MGSTRGGAKPPNQTAYFVALAGILVLLVLLCCYFVYFCVKRVRELTQHPESLTQPVVKSTAPPLIAYPVQPLVRDSATAMAALCKQPHTQPQPQPQPVGKTDTVFPAASSPAALHLHHEASPGAGAAGPTLTGNTAATDRPAT